MMQVTGVLLAFFLVFGYLFAASWPGRRQLLRKLRLEDFFLSFEVFYVTHAIMGIALLVLLIMHPRPASSSSETKGLTWAYLLAGTIVCIMERLARAIKYADGLIFLLHEGHISLCLGFKVPDLH